MRASSLFGTEDSFRKFFCWLQPKTKRNPVQKTVIRGVPRPSIKP